MSVFDVRARPSTTVNNRHRCNLSFCKKERWYANANIHVYIICIQTTIEKITLDGTNSYYTEISVNEGVDKFQTEI